MDIRPSTENVGPKLNTYQIVQQIRCELRDTIREITTNTLRFSGKEDEIVLAEKLENQEVSYQLFLESDFQNLSKETKRLLNRYRFAAIAYEFDFNIEEDNNLGGGIDFLKTYTGGNLSLGVSGQYDRKRSNVRNFKLLDTFGGMISSRSLDDECLDISEAPNKNYAYPISGSLGLQEVVDTFIGLDLSANLVGNTKDAKEIPTLSDTLTYTTTLSGTINPILKLAPTGDHLDVAGANLNAVSTRTDVHKLVLALTIPSKSDIPFATESDAIERAALAELERQRIRSIDNDTEEIRRILLIQ